MPWRVEIKKILDGDTAQIQQAIAAGFVLTGALQTRRGRTYLKKTFILPTAPKKKAVVVPAGGVGFDMSALSEALDQVAEANAAAAGAGAAAAAAGPAAAGAGAGAAPEWGGEEPIALEVADEDVDGLIAAMGGVAFQGGRRRRNRKTKSRRSKRRHTRKN